MGEDRSHHAMQCGEFLFGPPSAVISIENVELRHSQTAASISMQEEAQRFGMS